MSLRSKKPLASEPARAVIAPKANVPTMKDVFGLHGQVVDDAQIYAPTGDQIDTGVQRLGESPAPGAVLVGELQLNEDGSSVVRPNQVMHKGRVISLRNGQPIPYGNGIREYVSARLR